MLKMHLAAGLAATALMTAAAVAQTSTTTAPATTGGGASTTMSTSGSSGASTTMGSASGAAASGQLMTQMQPDMMRGSKLMGTDIYGSDNQKIGDLDDVILDRQGKIQAIVIGVGGFLGIGEKNVAIPYDQVQWMTSQEVQAQNNQNSGNATAGAAGSGTNTAGGMTTASGGANQPATTGSTTAGSSGNNDNMPARGMVRMTKADLQNAPEFRYNNDNRSNASGGAAGTNPPANANRPGAAPAQ
ncbi:MAG TPA: PRC-barrel domain-containing protein [Microvirga sp.]|jgi:sporulation protein YlmC with PRC-barrel domain|nr:PRC-barrel domain-containing protein [Microvirga sp.]